MTGHVKCCNPTTDRHRDVKKHTYVLSCLKIYTKLGTPRRVFSSDVLSYCLNFRNKTSKKLLNNY